MKCDGKHLALEERVLGLMRAAAGDEGAFDELACDIYRYQRAANLPYGNYCRQVGANEAIEDWRAIPAVPQSAFRRAALRSFPEEETAAVFRTSGTTGDGYGSHFFKTLRLYDESILRGWDHFDLPRLAQVIFVLRPVDAPHSSLSHMMGVLRARAKGGEQHFCLTRDGQLEVARLREAVEPVLVMGTALAFLGFLELGEQFVLPAGSTVLETGGYKGVKQEATRAALYRALSARMGIAEASIINEYGMTELSSPFYSRGPDGIHRGPPWTRVMIVEPETDREVAVGETGTVRVFDLANVGSVLAIQTQDLAVRRMDGFELLGRDPKALPRGCSRAADELLSSLR